MKRIAIIVLLLASCAQPEKKPEAPALRALGQSATIEPSRNDEAIGFEVRHRLELIGAADTSGMIVEVNDGVVTLTGEIGRAHV